MYFGYFSVCLPLLKVLFALGEHVWIERCWCTLWITNNNNDPLLHRAFHAGPPFPHAGLRRGLAAPAAPAPAPFLLVF